MNGHLYFLLGVSGSGKGTLRKNLEKEEIKNLHFLKSYVTRNMRPGEIDGDIYNFISEDEFKDLIDEEEFLEYAYVHQAGYYGTKKADILEGIENGKKLIKEVDFQGLAKIKDELPNFKNHYTTLFLHVPADIMIKRNKERNPNVSKEELEKRLCSFEKEVENMEENYDHIIDATQAPKKVMEDVLAIMKK